MDLPVTSNDLHSGNILDLYSHVQNVLIIFMVFILQMEVDKASASLCSEELEEALVFVDGLEIELVTLRLDYVADITVPRTSIDL